MDEVKFKEKLILDNELATTKNQVFVIVAMTLLISMVSGIHRFLISLLTNLLAESSTTGLYNYIDKPAPIILWLGLAFTIAPFGLAKAITDYYAGSFEKHKKVLYLGTLFYIGGVIVVIISIIFATNRIASLFLPLASGFIGAGEGFFLATSQILLSAYTSGKNRGRYLGFSEFSIYGGYTIGSLTAGFLSAGQDFTLSYAYSLIIVLLTILLIKEVLHEKPVNETVLKSVSPLTETSGEQPPSQKYSSKGNFKPAKLLRNTRILSVLLVSHFSKWGDALILLLPVYFAYIFSLAQDPTVVVPDTVTIGFLLGLYTATWAIGMSITSYITEVLGRRAPILAGLLLSGIGFIGLSTLSKTTSDIFLMTAVTLVMAGLGTGLYYPLLPAVGLDIAKPKYQGQTLALFRTFRDFGYFTGPIFLIILVYLNGASIKSVPWVITFTGALMLLLAFFILVTLRETRPIWPFFEAFVMQIELIQKDVKKSVAVFNEENIEDEKKITKLVKEAKILEQKADKKKRQLYKELLMPMGKRDDVSDFIMLVELSDKISNHTAMAALKYSKIFNFLPQIPKPLLEALKDLSLKLPPMMDELLESIILLNEKVTLTVKHQKILSTSESDADILYGNFLSLLYQFEPFYPETEKFTIMMTLKEISELLEKVTDIILQIGDTLSMIAWKHRL